jgi:hypothetical protein
MGRNKTIMKMLHRKKLKRVKEKAIAQKAAAKPTENK